MTHVSKKRLDKNIDQMLQDLMLSVYSDKNSKEFLRIYNLLLTNTERIMLKKRLGVFLLINTGFTLQQTADILKLTKQTVHRIKLQLYEVPDEDKKYLQNQIEKWSRINEFKKLLNSIKDLNISQARFRRELTKNI